MTSKSRVLSATNTHSQDGVMVGDSEFEVVNHQEGMMLLDPEDVAAGNTHSAKAPKANGDKKLRASIVDEDRAKGGRIAALPNDVDPAAGYLELESGMPVINNIVADADEDEDEDEDEVQSEFEDLENTEPAGDDIDADVDEDEEFIEADADEEFDDADDEDGDELGAYADEYDDLEALDGPDVEVEADLEDGDVPEVDVPLAFETETDTDSVSLLDADSVEDSETDDVLFAVTANVIHAMRGNRIIASMGPTSAAKVGMRDVYLSDQFQQVVEATLSQKGLRKGLVQSGFVLARVKVAAASKVTATIVKNKVEAQLQTRLEALAKKEAGMDQALAIAAVGVNRSFFKDAKNELRANLEAEFTRMGVRGAGKVVRAMFARHGVAYAQELLALAKRIAAMPEEVRDEYASALDLTNDEEEFGIEAAEDFETEDFDTEEEAIEPASITAALMQPARRNNVPALLKAGVSSSAMSILNGNGGLL